MCAPPPQSGKAELELKTATDPEVRVTQLTVYGMCCQSEVELVNSKLRPLPGVSHVAVNLMLRRVAVTHDAQTAPERLVRALNWALLDAKVDDGGASSGGGSLLKRRVRDHKMTALLIVCGILFGVSFGTWKRVADGRVRRTRRRSSTSWRRRRCRAAYPRTEFDVCELP